MLNKDKLLVMLDQLEDLLDRILHYEILLNNKQINPQKLNLTRRKKIKKEELEEFIKIKENILKNIKQLINKFIM